MNLFQLDSEKTNSHKKPIQRWNILRFFCNQETFPNQNIFQSL